MIAIIGLHCFSSNLINTILDWTVEHPLSVAGGNNFVVMADPNLLETILRAEGKYPRRDTTLSSNMAWLMTKLDYPVSVAFE